MACRALIGHAMLGMTFKYDLSTLRLVKRWKERLQIPRDESERCAYGTRLQCCVAGACCILAPVLCCWCVLSQCYPYPAVSMVHVYTTSSRTSLSYDFLGCCVDGAYTSRHVHNRGNPINLATRLLVWVWVEIDLFTHRRRCCCTIETTTYERFGTAQTPTPALPAAFIHCIAFLSALSLSHTQPHLDVFLRPHVQRKPSHRTPPEVLLKRWRLYPPRYTTQMIQ